MSRTGGRPVAEDCEASNSSSGEDCPFTDSELLSPRKLHNKYLDRVKGRSKTFLRPHRYPKNRKSSGAAGRAAAAARRSSRESASTDSVGATPSSHASVSVTASASDERGRWLAGGGGGGGCGGERLNMSQRDRAGAADGASRGEGVGEAGGGGELGGAASKCIQEPKRVFPFLKTPSGNLKIGPNQVVFESNKLSVLVADPRHTKVKVKADVSEGTRGGGGREQPEQPEQSARMPLSPDKARSSGGAVQRLAGGGTAEGGDGRGLASLRLRSGGSGGGPGEAPPSEDDYEPARQEREFSLMPWTDVSFPSIDWSINNMPPKSELFSLLLHRITNYVNPDVEVLIANDLFNCHLLVLQCYSVYFEETKQASKVRLPEAHVTPRAFTIIYQWMIDPGTDCHRHITRETILDVFLASQYLAIKELEEQCWTFINSDSIFSEEAAFLMYTEARNRDISSISQLMVPRVMRFFLKLVGTSNFLELGVEDLCVFLRSNYIAVHSEIEVFMAAVRWLMHDWAQRKAHLLAVMQCVRFGWVPPWQLVDIRRNPENPEFMRVTACAEVQRLVEDGLAYAIIKYWYGNQTQDYFHWIDLLGLQEPHQRNWVDEEKNYVKYKDFLKDLQIYQLQNALEKMQLRSQQPERSDFLPPPPSIAELMAHRLGNNTAGTPQRKGEIGEEIHIDAENEKMHYTLKLKREDCIQSLLHFRDVNNSTTFVEQKLGSRKIVDKNSPSHASDTESTTSEMQQQQQQQQHQDKQDHHQQQQHQQQHVQRQDQQDHRQQQQQEHYVQRQDQQDHRQQQQQEQQQQHYVQRQDQQDHRQQQHVQHHDRQEQHHHQHNHQQQHQEHRQQLRDAERAPESAEAGLRSRAEQAGQERPRTQERSPPPGTGAWRSPAHSKGRREPVAVTATAASTALAVGSERPLSPLESRMGALLTCSSRERVSLRHTLQLSASALGPAVARNYLADGSLFFPERESVLVFGGVDPHAPYGGDATNSGRRVYRYHPETNAWEAAAELPQPRHHHAVAFLRGRVFVVGGADPREEDVRGNSLVVGSVWSFDPVSCAWSDERPLLTARKNFGLVVSNGKMYAIGGQDAHGRVLASVERFDPVTSVWEAAASLAVARMGAAAAKFRDYIWVAGGMAESKRNPLCCGVECYDSRRNVWLSFCALRFPRCFGRLFSMNEALYLIGGASRAPDAARGFSSIGSVDVWDARSKEWRLKAEMASPRHGHSLAYLGSQILILGGVSTQHMRALNTVESFCCDRGVWFRGVTPLPARLSGHGSITLPPASLM